MTLGHSKHKVACPIPCTDKNRHTYITEKKLKFRVSEWQFPLTECDGDELRLEPVGLTFHTSSNSGSILA